MIKGEDVKEKPSVEQINRVDNIEEGELVDKGSGVLRVRTGTI